MQAEPYLRSIVKFLYLKRKFVIQSNTDRTKIVGDYGVPVEQNLGWKTRSIVVHVAFITVSFQTIMEVCVVVRYSNRSLFD